MANFAIFSIPNECTCIAVFQWRLIIVININLQVTDVDNVIHVRLYKLSVCQYNKHSCQTLEGWARIQAQAVIYRHMI